METDKDKIIISVQLPMFIVDWLKTVADEECTSVSYIIRRTLIKEKRETEEDK